MFATKILKYVVQTEFLKLNSIAENVNRKYLTQRHFSNQISSGAIIKNSGLSGIQQKYYTKPDKTLRKRCAVSEPTNASSKLNKSTLNHRNIKEAAALVHVIEDHALGKNNVHHIGSMPNNKTVYEHRQKQPIKIKVSQKAAAKIIKYKPKNDTSTTNTLKANTNDFKPYVINIYLDSKRIESQHPAEDDEHSLRSKIQQFWAESLKEEEEKRQIQETAVNNIEREEQVERNIDEILKQQDVITAPKGEEYEDTIQEDAREKPILKFSNTSNRKKQVKDEDMEEAEDEEDEPPKVTPVQTGGFTKYLNYWKKMFAAGRTNKSKIEEENEQKFEKIENDKVFNPSSSKLTQKFNPYDFKLKEQPELEVLRRYISRTQKSHYSTLSCANEFLGSKTKSAIHIRIIPENFNTWCSHYDYSTKLSKLNEEYETKKSTNRTNTSEKHYNNQQTTRIDDFVSKLKDAMTTEVKDFKKVTVIYDHNKKKITMGRR